jgi:hypothetical protein
MRTVSLRVAAIFTLTLGLGLAMLPADPPPDREKLAQAAIVKLSEHLDANDVPDQAKKIVHDFASDEISSIFRKKDQGGLGIGSAAEVIHQDGIERMIRDLSRRKTISEAELEKYQVDYVRVAKVMQAMAQLAPYRANERIKKDDKRLQQWLQTASDFQRKTGDFRKAVEDRDPKKVRLTAFELNHTCCDCHGQLD